jgi:hypothetical protein
MGMAFAHLLAQDFNGSPSGSGKYGEVDVLMWGGILILVVLFGAMFIMLLRRRLNRVAAPPQDAGFSLADLRAMRDRGEITPAEYERTRANVIAKVKNQAEDPPKPVPPDEDAPKNPAE